MAQILRRSGVHGLCRGAAADHTALPGRLRPVARYVTDPGSKRLFEIGSAYGFFLEVARQHFRSVEGIDISTAAAAYAKEQLGVQVAAGEFLAHRIAGPVDVVCLWDTIEHLRDPHLYIEKAAAYLRRGGALAVTTGDIGSLMARWRGERWRQIHPPTHLHYFSKLTLAQLLERYGFTIAYAGYDGMYRASTPWRTFFSTSNARDLASRAEEVQGAQLEPLSQSVQHRVHDCHEEVVDARDQMLEYFPARTIA